MVLERVTAKRLLTVSHAILAVLGISVIVQIFISQGLHLHNFGSTVYTYSWVSVIAVVIAGFWALFARKCFPNKKVFSQACVSGIVSLLIIAACCLTFVEVKDVINDIQENWYKQEENATITEYQQLFKCCGYSDPLPEETWCETGSERCQEKVNGPIRTQLTATAAVTLVISCALAVSCILLFIKGDPVVYFEEEEEIEDHIEDPEPIEQHVAKDTPVGGSDGLEDNLL